MATSIHSREPSRGQPTRKKYKDSCNNCAACKVKCNRDKPQCTRCEDRGLICNYSLSQRSGRRPTIGQAPLNTNASSKSRSNSKEPPAAEDDAAANKKQIPELPPLSVAPSFEPDDFGSIDLSSIISWDSVAGSLNSSDPTPLGPKFDIPYSNYFPELLQESPGMWLGDTSSTDLPTGDVFDISSSVSYVSDTTSLVHVENTDTRSIETKGSTTDSPAQTKSCCSTRTVDVLNRLHTHSSNCCFSEPQNTKSHQGELGSFEDIVTVNRECINAVMTMLECPCSANQQTLFMISMIVDEVLNRYNGTALDCAKGSSDTNPRSSQQTLVFGKYQIEGPDATRMSTAMILGELHLVVRLLQRLSRRSREIGDRDTLMHDVSEQSHTLTTNPMSPSVFVQVEASMRKRLRLVRDNLTQLMKQS